MLGNRQLISRKITVVLIILSLFAESSVFAAKKKKNTGQVTDTYQGEGDAIKISSSKKNRTFFSSVNEQVVHDVENGSPESLSQAMAALRKSESEYTDQSRSLLHFPE